MSYLLEILGRGLLAELAAAFRPFLRDDGRYSTAELREACREHGDDPATHTRLGTRHLAERDTAAAGESFRRALEIDAANLRAHVGLACVHDEVGRTDQALRQLQEAAEHHADDPAVQFGIGFCLEKLGRVGEAAAAYRRALETAPSLRNAHERLAAIHVQQDEWPAAIEHYEQICSCQPEEIDSRLMLANLYLRVGRHQDAIRCYQTALTLDPDQWEPQNDLVTACDQAGLYYEAIDQLRSMIQERPCAENHLRLGDLYVKVGRAEDALAEYLGATRVNPDYLEAAIKVGTSYLRGGGYEEAAKWFHRALEINDRLLSAYVGLSVAQTEAGRPDEARETLELAAGVEPNSTLLFSEIARLHLRCGAARQVSRYLDPSAAAASGSGPAAGSAGDLLARQIERYQTAAKEHPNYADLHYQLGLLLRHCGRKEEAIAAFTAATRINPNYEKALTKLGLFQQEIGRSDEALHVLRRALVADPESAELHYRLGLIFADRYKFDLAVQQFEFAAAREPENLEFRANLALALQNMGLLDRAESSWRVLCDVASQTEAGREIIAEALRLPPQSGLRPQPKSP
jgi:tetratricopeptide (TPR) repeat protein